MSYEQDSDALDRSAHFNVAPLPPTLRHICDCIDDMLSNSVSMDPAKLLAKIEGRGDPKIYRWLGLEGA